MSFHNLTSKLQCYYTWLNQRSGGIPEILVIVFQRFSQERGAQAAASVGYYALFSLFPLLLVLVWILGYFLSGWITTIEIAELARRIHGAYGYTREFKIEMLSRALAGATGVATSLEINRSIVGGSLLTD